MSYDGIRRVSGYKLGHVAQCLCLIAQSKSCSTSSVAPSDCTQLCPVVVFQTRSTRRLFVGRFTVESLLVIRASQALVKGYRQDVDFEV